MDTNLNSINEMVFDRQHYTDDKEFWGHIALFLQSLVTNTYVATIREDEYGIIAIHYEHDNTYDDWDCRNPYWLTEEEYVRALETGEDE